MGLVATTKFPSTSPAHNRQQQSPQSCHHPSTAPIGLVTSSKPNSDINPAVTSSLTPVELGCGKAEPKDADKNNILFKNLTPLKQHASSRHQSDGHCYTMVYMPSSGSVFECMFQYLKATRGGQWVPYYIDTSIDLSRPLLLHGRKFDIRVWVLLLPPYEIFMHRQGVMRTSSDDYASSKSVLAHVTNHTVCKPKDVIIMSTKRGVNCGSAISISWFSGVVVAS
jgi:hypothetical protein